MLEVARQFDNKAGAALGGTLIVELKDLSPHCDPTDNLEQAAVSAATAEIHQAKMDDQVIFDSFSPALLFSLFGRRRRFRESWIFPAGNY